MSAGVRAVNPDGDARTQCHAEGKTQGKHRRLQTNGKYYALWDLCKNVAACSMHPGLRYVGRRQNGYACTGAAGAAEQQLCGLCGGRRYDKDREGWTIVREVLLKLMPKGISLRSTKSRTEECLKRGILGNAAAGSISKAYAGGHFAKKYTNKAYKWKSGVL